MTVPSGDIIGRGDELFVVEAFLDDPTAGLKALVLEGEAGIGKSTLWLGAVAAARRRSFQVLTSRPAETERALSHVVLGDLFGDIEPGRLAFLPPPRRLAFETAVLREGSDLQVDARALGVAILTLLPVLADDRPLVLAIDDDQWMDPSSAATLQFALRRAIQQRVLLLLSRRVDGGRSMALEDAIDPAAIERVRVGPLSVGAIQVLLRRRLGITMPRPTLLQLHEVSGGNPFCALELARTRSAQTAQRATVPWTFPADLDQIVGARLQGFNRPTRTALLLVAANGRLPVELVRALNVTPAAFEPAQTAKVTETVDGTILFTHPLFASAVYHGATPEDRRTAHRHLASALDDAVQRGRHVALGANEPSHERAMDVESAATVANERGIPMAAAELLEHALRLTPRGAIDDLHRRALATARAHLEAGESARARAIVDDLLATTPPGPRRAEVLVLASDLAEPGPAVTLLEQALTEAEAAPALKATIHIGLAYGLGYTMGSAWAGAHTDVAVRLAEQLDDDALRSAALSIRALYLSGSGDPAALAMALQGHRLALPLADPKHVKAAGFWVGYVLMSMGDDDGARHWFESQLEAWGDRDEQVRADALLYLALVEFSSGRWALAREYDEASQEIFSYDMRYRDLPQLHFPPALLALHRGDFEVARDHANRALAHGPRPLPLPQPHAVLGVCDLWTGDPAAAVASLVRAEEAADTRGWDDPYARWWRADYAEALLQLGRVDDAASLIAGWEAMGKRLGRERVVAQAVRCRGLIAAARGDLETALDLIGEAVDRHETVGDPFGRARANLALGVTRRRARQKRSARTALEAALTDFEALGAASWAATARAELARIGGRERMEGLSPSEVRVAQLVAEGRTNREVASALFLGERTVAGHLTRIYAKLDVRSRTELARRLLPPNLPSPVPERKVETS